MSQQKVTVRILDRDYHFACSDEERPSLIQAAEHLDNTMRDIKAGNSTLVPEQVAIMAALNISHDLMQCQNSNQIYSGTVSRQIHDVRQTLEAALKENASDLSA